MLNLREVSRSIAGVVYIASIIGFGLFHLYTMYCFWYMYGVLGSIVSFFFPLVSELIMFFVCFDYTGIMAIYCLSAIALTMSYFIAMLVIGLTEE